MCLSTAYLNKKDKEHVAAEYVAKIHTVGRKITLTDVMGFDTEVDGEILFVDLNGGVIIIDTQAAAEAV